MKVNVDKSKVMGLYGEEGLEWMRCDWNICQNLEHEVCFW